jgi:hypothetical protein
MRSSTRSASSRRRCVRRRSRLLAGLVAALAVAALVAGGYVWGAHQARGDRQAEVAARGAKVMPFDLDRTTHVFDERDDGGVRTVVADDPGDEAEIGAIRAHLESEAEEFRNGRFDDPTAIHGSEMPGVAELRAGAGRIEIRYEDVPDGGRITYVTRDPTLVRALHAWFDAQLTDHGAHATTPSP